MLELTIAMMCATVLMCGLYTLARSSYDSQWELVNQNNANLAARQGVDYLADHLRGAYTVKSASTSDITIADSAGNQTRFYWNSADNTLCTSGGSGGTSTNSTVLQYNVQSLTFTYWYWVTATGTWASVLPLPADLTTIGGIDINAVINVNGYQKQVTSSVHLRYCKYPQ